jgi:hypothetical protein
MAGAGNFARGINRRLSHDDFFVQTASSLRGAIATRHARSAATPGQRRGCAALAFSRTGDCATREADHRRDGLRVERIDRIGLESATQDKTTYHVEDNDPLSAVAELSHTQTLSRNEWQVRVETQMRLSSTSNDFRLRGSLRAWEGAKEVCRRDWDRSIPRDFL